MILYMGLKGSTQVIPPKQSSFFVGKSPSLVWKLKWTTHIIMYFFVSKSFLILTMWCQLHDSFCILLYVEDILFGPLQWYCSCLFGPCSYLLLSFYLQCVAPLYCCICGLYLILSQLVPLLLCIKWIVSI